MAVVEFEKERPTPWTMIKIQLQLFAHKKGTGSSHNGRDSNAQRLGTKAHNGQLVTAGSIIVRQRGTRFHARGPMGLPELTTFKYLINGNGQIR